MNDPAEDELACALCERKHDSKNPIWTCSACALDQCEECWNSNPLHRRKLKGVGGIPHDKLDPRMVANLKTCTEPPENPTTAHWEDRDTAWFGVWTDSNDAQYHLQDLGRYASLMVKSAFHSTEKRYPKIVSFIGETGNTLRN
jgi:hypothetical protein